MMKRGTMDKLAQALELAKVLGDQGGDECQPWRKVATCLQALIRNLEERDELYKLIAVHLNSLIEGRIE